MIPGGQRLFQDLFERIGQDEAVQVDAIDRGAMGAAMDAGLAEVDRLGTLRFELFVEDEFAVEPEAGDSFGRVFRPMDVHGEFVPLAGREIGGPFGAVAAEVPGAVFNKGAAAVGFRFHPPSHDVVIAGRGVALPIEEVIAVLGRVGHVEGEGHIRVRALFDGDAGAAELDAELARIEDIVFVDRDFGGVFALVDDVGDELDVAGGGVLATGAGLGPLGKVAGFEVS